MKIRIDISGTLRKYKRVIQVARKPTKEEFIKSGKISAIGMFIIGFLGFLIFLVFAFAGI